MNHGNSSEGFTFAGNHNLVIILSLINFCGKTRTSKNQNQFRLTLSVLFKSSYGVLLKRKGKYEFILSMRTNTNSMTNKKKIMLQRKETEIEADLAMSKLNNSNK